MTDHRAANRRRLPRPPLREGPPRPPQQSRTRKRSSVASMEGIGFLAVIGLGLFSVTNGFGLGGERRMCSTNEVATTQARCEALLPGPACGAAFAGGAPAVGLTRREGVATWSHQALRDGGFGRYTTAGGQTFRTGETCQTTSTRRSYFHWGGGSAAGRSSTGSYSSRQGAQRSGFGSTARGFSRSLGG